MYKILSREKIAPAVVRLEIQAPQIAKKRKAGQFVVIRIDEQGERIPLTLADANPRKGTITLVVQAVGKSTCQLALLDPKQGILDIVGPLGKPTYIEKFGRVVGIGGGIGIAPLHPIAQALKAAGNQVISILGARSQDLLIMEEELKAASHEILICTDDGSYGKKGLVTDILDKVIQRGEKIDLVIAVGPPVMMKFVCALTKKHNLKTMVSLNPIMLDASGMCGVCRVLVDGKTHFACVDGPEFDGHKVDFELLMQRLQTYKTQEKTARDLFHKKHQGCCSQLIN